MKRNVTALLFSAMACAQSGPSFEVATIKPHAPGDMRVMFGIEQGGRFQASNVTVKMLIQRAYDIKDFQITSGPSWIASDHFDVLAKPESAANQDQIRQMLQSLLADRFQLVMHRETKEMPVYALVAAKSGVKLKEASESDPPMSDFDGRGGRGGRGGRQGLMRMGRGQLSGQGIAMPELATQLSNFLGRSVVDKTGLTGRYDLKLEWTPDESQAGIFRGPGDSGAPPDSSGPSLFTALQEQLGLRLESQKGAVELFIIDRLEKPSEN